MFSKKSCLALLVCAALVSGSQAFAISLLPDLTPTTVQPIAGTDNLWVQLANHSDATASCGYLQIRFYGDNALARTNDVAIQTGPSVSFNAIPSDKARWIQAALPSGWEHFADLTHMGATCYFKVVVVAMPGSVMHSFDFELTR